MVFSRRSRESSGGGGGSSSRTRDTAESGTPRGDGFAAFMRSQSGRIGAAADPADTRRRQLSTRGSGVAAAWLHASDEGSGLIWISRLAGKGQMHDF